MRGGEEEGGREGESQQKIWHIKYHSDPTGREGGRVRGVP